MFGYCVKGNSNDMTAHFVHTAKANHGLKCMIMRVNLSNTMCKFGDGTSTTSVYNCAWKIYDHQCHTQQMAA